MGWQEYKRVLQIGYLKMALSSSLFAFLASQRGMLAHSPLAIPQGTQLRGPAGSLRCSICRGRAQTRFAQTPRTSFSRQLCATRPLRWDLIVCALTWLRCRARHKIQTLRGRPAFRPRSKLSSNAGVGRTAGRTVWGARRRVSAPPPNTE